MGKEFLPQKCTLVGPSSIELEFSEILPKKCRVYGAADMDLPYDLPVDSATRIPMLAFYGVLVQENESIGLCKSMPGIQNSREME